MHGAECGVQNKICLMLFARCSMHLCFHALCIPTMQSWVYYPAMAVFVNGINTEEVPQNSYQRIFGITNGLSGCEQESLFVHTGISLCRTSVTKGKCESNEFRMALKKINGFQSTVFSTPMRVYRSMPVCTEVVIRTGIAIRSRRPFTLQRKRADPKLHLHDR
jgi:hypothetical protein